MHGFGFGTGRGTGFIHSTGLFMSIIDHLAADQIMVDVVCSSIAIPHPVHRDLTRAEDIIALFDKPS